VAGRKTVAIHPDSDTQFADSEMRETAQARSAKGRVGQPLGDRFFIDALLGVGGSAAVYAATRKDGKRVAIKMLHLELSRLEASKTRFSDELHASNRVEHPGAVPISEEGIAEDGSAFLVMDLLEGEPLAARLSRSGPMTAAGVLPIADELLDVLAAAHDRGIVHRDVKPGNIFLTEGGGVRLLDFGTAYLETPMRATRTEPGTAMGTPAFMAPEQARGRSEELDGRTDLWAVGATMFTMLSGRRVHLARTINEELLAAMTEPAPSLATALHHAPSEVVKLVDTSLAFQKERRFQSARAMQLAVRKALSMLREGTTSISPRLDTARTLPGLPEEAADETPPPEGAASRRSAGAPKVK
jgi:serine/threonine protein kinase